jgi:hypothetical protein
MSDYITIHLSKQGKHKGKYEAIVSPEDKDLAAFRWRVLIQGDNLVYAMRTDYTGEKPKEILLHREVMESMLGHAIPDGYEVDHKDGNPLNSIRPNLRLATRAENVRNTRTPKNNTSGYKGVSWNKPLQKWRARIKVNNKNIHLGLFDDPELAHKAYCEAADKYHGEYANHGDV